GRPQGDDHRRARDRQDRGAVRGLVAVTRWPAVVRAELPSGKVVTLRPLQRTDRAAWDRMRREEAGWLRPWEATLPGGSGPPAPFRRVRRDLERAARRGEILPFAIDVDGRLAGQMHLFDIVWGSRHTGTAGYWLSRRTEERRVGKESRTPRGPVRLKYSMI